MLAVLDPCLVAPHLGQNVDVEKVVGAIRRLRSEVAEGVLTLLVSDELYATLDKEGLYPLRDSLERYVSSEAGERVHSGVDVARVLLDLLARGIAIESVIADFEVAERRDNLGEVTRPACSCHPGMEVATLDALEAACALSAAVPEMTPDFVASVRIASAALQLEVTFDSILCVDERLLESVTHTLSVPLSATVASALSVVDPARIVKRVGTNPAEARWAIAAGAEQHDTAACHTNWDLHSLFIADLTSPSIQNNPTLLRKVFRACAEVICDTDQASSHGLRSGAGPESAQVTFGKRRAWRQDVDHEWHIHFWRSESGHIQFASVRGHGYMGIPDPEIQD